MNEDGFVLLTHASTRGKATMKDPAQKADPATFEIVKNSL